MLKSRIYLHPLTLGIFVALLALSCKQSTESGESAVNGQETQEAPAQKYKLTPFTASQDFPDAALTRMEYKNGKFTFDISGESYKLGLQTPDAPAKGCANSGQGQHIHLIVDNLPYAAKYESSFDYEIPDGEHYILAFLSRSYHESIKTKQASIAVKGIVSGKSITESSQIDKPMLFYSRPKGAYDGDDTKRVMLDYYLVNPNTEYQVKATINGEDHMLKDWQPYYIEGLPAGENEITLTLVDAQGNRVPTDLNPVTRKFTLNPNPAEN